MYTHTLESNPEMASQASGGKSQQLYHIINNRIMGHAHTEKNSYEFIRNENCIYAREIMESERITN
jgi:hypothetical protein